MKQSEILHGAKSVTTVHQSLSRHWVGNGFFVYPMLSYDGLGRELNPFILLDYAAPLDFPPGTEKRGVGAHPHKGFETVTVVYQGELEHRDSSGGGGKIGPGDVQWMTAGAGILHEEFHSEEFVRQGGVMEMVQLWVNLPADKKGAAPRYQTLTKGEIPVVSLPEKGGTVRVIAGGYDGKKGPAETFTRISLLDISLQAGGSARFTIPAGDAAGFIVLRGRVVAGEGESAKRLSAGSFGALSPEGECLTLHAEEDSTVLLMNGEAIKEPIAARGPFVMNTYEEIEAAYRDFRHGKLGSL